MKTVTAVLEYEGQRYTYEDDWIPREDDTDEDIRHLVHYMWTEGNYSCDCNRFAFMGFEEPEDENFPCGDTVKLVSLRIAGDPVCVMCNGSGVDCGITVSRILRQAFKSCWACEHCNGTGEVGA
jgi:hypothetical protein